MYMLTHKVNIPIFVHVWIFVCLLVLESACLSPVSFKDGGSDLPVLHTCVYVCICMCTYICMYVCIFSDVLRQSYYM